MNSALKYCLTFVCDKAVILFSRQIHMLNVNFHSLFYFRFNMLFVFILHVLSSFIIIRERENIYLETTAINHIHFARNIYVSLLNFASLFA